MERLKENEDDLRNHRAMPDAIGCLSGNKPKTQCQLGRGFLRGFHNWCSTDEKYKLCRLQCDKNV